MTIYYVDGKYIPSDKAVIPVDDLSILRGYGVFDIMHTYKGRPYFLNEHIQRLENSAKKVGLALPWNRAKIKKIVLQTLILNPDIDEANIRIVVTGGSSPDFFTPKGNPRLIVMVTPIKKAPDSWYSNGIKTITIRQEREVPEAKVTSYIKAALALKKAEKQNAMEAIYVNKKNEVLEGTTSNLFAFLKNRLVTPNQGVLKGITRKVILSLGHRFFKVEERPLKLEELFQADEVFITGTNKMVVPVIQVDDKVIGQGKPGKNTQTIIQALDQHILDFMETPQ
ncbi:MAG: branched-chain amino acid aminotransferase [Desulfobacteraceae bacterium]|nr:branched-chain amino acid aminotransferase [Desulfobacteraceae bacterium]